MDQTFIDNCSNSELENLKEEVEILQQKVDYLRGKIQSIQYQCRHIFLETSSMRECQKCGFAESTYY